MLSFEEFEKATNRELRCEAKDCFERTLFLEAQFYMQEIDRRHDSKIARRDLFLEMIVILLIGCEIVLGIWGIVIARKEGKDQADLLGKQETILEHLDTSTSNTAATLVLMQSTMEAMKTAEQHQLALFYDVSLFVVANDASKMLTINNSGRTTITLWGWKPTPDFVEVGFEGRTLAPGSGYQISVVPFYDSLIKSTVKGTDHFVPFELYVKNERGEEFTVRSNIGLTWEKDVPRMIAHTVSILPENWSRHIKRTRFPSGMPLPSSSPQNPR